ncbi:MAG: tRNA (adenosine(37)-N6)-dimethylallyltransferase MiaA [Bacteroidetes bacterium]|nr:tRNA (adenosine(37)-N6)-dimethylallyltransferase MiaA [Bacteroidota bacterium]
MSFNQSKKYLIVILGPTAVGKTVLAIDIAKEFDTEIISADSRQFFREMNIGTAKPNNEELKSVKHHFINSISVHDEYNAGIFEREALKTLETIYQKNGIAVMTGGSGLYINAVCNGFDELPHADKEIRAKIIEMYKLEGIEYLRDTLKKLDEEHYKKIDIKNPHRLIRAIEVCMVTGMKYSEMRVRDKGQGAKERKFAVIKIGLEMEREKLYERINLRVDEMMKQGLLDEVKNLFKYKHLNSLQTVGYKELFDFMEGKIDLNRAVELIKQNTRNFAKRQMTWFRKDKTIKWFDPREKTKIIQYVKDEF